MYGVLGSPFARWGQTGTMPERFRKDVSKMKKGIKGMVAVLLTAAELAEKSLLTVS